METMKYYGISEIAKKMNLSRQRVDQLLRRKDAPDSVAILKLGRVWLVKDIDRWIGERNDRLSDK